MGKRKFEVTYEREDEQQCVVNFVDKPIFERAKEKFFESALFIAVSSVALNKEEGTVDANLVSPLEKFCELYLDYCCKDNENLCRVHLDKEFPRIGLEVKGADLETLKRALDDFINCTR